MISYLKTGHLGREKAEVKPYTNQEGKQYSCLDIDEGQNGVGSKLVGTTNWQGKKRKCGVRRPVFTREKKDR